jgi:hypothetical protein
MRSPSALAYLYRDICIHTLLYIHDFTLSFGHICILVLLYRHSFTFLYRYIGIHTLLCWHLRQALATPAAGIAILACFESTSCTGITKLINNIPVHLVLYKHGLADERVSNHLFVSSCIGIRRFRS